MIITLAARLGISALLVRVILYLLLATTLGAGVLAVRQHYVNLGWHKAISAVKKQDDRAVEAADRVQERAAKCDETNGYWDVITQNCKLQEEENGQ